MRNVTDWIFQSNPLGLRRRPGRVPRLRARAFVHQPPEGGPGLSDAEFAGLTPGIVVEPAAPQFCPCGSASPVHGGAASSAPPTLAASLPSRSLR